MKVSPHLKSLGIGNLYLVERPSGILYAENSHKERVSLRTKNRDVAEEILRGHKASVERPNFAYNVTVRPSRMVEGPNGIDWEAR